MEQPDMVEEGSFNGSDSFEEDRQPDNPLSRRAKKICSFLLTEDVVANLEAVGSPRAVKDASMRRNLQADLENRVLEEHQSFVQEMKTIVQNLEEGHAKMSSVNQSIKQKMEDLSALKEGSRSFIEKTRSLDQEIKATDQKLLIAQRLRACFTLTPREVEVLTRTTPTDRGLSRDFFDAFRKVKIISSRCKTLMRINTNSQILGVQLLDHASKDLEIAYQKLYRWSVDESRKMTTENPIISPTFCEALSHFESRSAVLKSVLDEYAAARKTVVTSMFLSALTQGTPASSRPLELHSYDSLRYITLLLGWIHQAVATEKDYLTSLLKNVKKVDFFETFVHIFSILTEGVATPLRSRLEHVTNTEKGVVVLYKIRHWTVFYIEKIRTTIAKNNSEFQNSFLEQKNNSEFQNSFLEQKNNSEFQNSLLEQKNNSEFSDPVLEQKNSFEFSNPLLEQKNSFEFSNPLLDVLTESLEVFCNQYIFALKNLASSFGKKLDVPHENLQPSFSLTSVLSLLRELINCHEFSFQYGAGDDLTVLISLVLEPLLQMCNESASHVSPNTPTVTAVYLLNCLYVIKSALSVDSSSSSKNTVGNSSAELLDRQCDAHIDTLVSETSNNIMSAVRMRPLLDVLRFPEQSRTMPDDYDVEQFLMSFNLYLTNPDDFLPREIGMLQNSLVKSGVIRTSHQLVSDYYKQIYSLLIASKFASSVNSPEVVNRFLVQ